MSDEPPREAEQLEGVPLPEQRGGVVGHETALAGLTDLLAGGRLPGGILLHGPQGIGKATLAFEAARRIFAATGDEEAGHVRDQVASGSYPNLRVLRRAARETGRGFYAAIRVEEVRELIDRLHKTRGRAGHRLVIVDSIDDCNPSSANALLKILEEPPSETLFLLVSHRPGQLLPTIRSRCHQVALRPLPDEQVRDVLVGIRPESEPEALAQAVALAGGRPRRGLEALLMTDAASIAALQRWLADPLRGAAAGHLAIADGLADRDSASARFAREIILEWLAAAARTAAVAGDRGLLASANELWEKATALFADADEYNLDPRQTLVMVFDAIRKHATLTTAAAEHP